MDPKEIVEDTSGPSSLSSDQASLCVIPDPEDSSGEDDFIHLDKTCLASSVPSLDSDRAVIVFHSVEEEYQTGTDVLCQYIRPKDWNETAKDTIGLFKVGWVSIGECIVMVPISENQNQNSIGNALFAASSLPKDNINLYQFCYLRDSVLLGASTPFQFVQTAEQESVLSVENKGNSTNLQVEEKLAEQLRSRDLDLTRLQEIFTKLACSKDEQDKVYSSTVEGLEKQLEFQSVYIKKLAEEKAGLLTEKSQMSQEITNLSALIEELKMKSHPNFDSPSENEKSAHSFQDLEKKSLSTIFGNGISASSSCVFHNAAPSSSRDDSSYDVLSVKLTECQNKESNDSKYSGEAELMWLKQRLSDVIEEKRLFQEQYAMASVTLKQCTDELEAEHVNLAALKSYVSELMASHKQACSELKEELKIASNKHQETISENLCLRGEINHLRDQLKKFEEDKQKIGCQCEVTKRKLEEMAMCLSTTDLIKATLQAELDEELKLGEDRDRRLAQLEQTMFSNLQSRGQQVSVSGNSGNGTSLYEMEQNVNSTLEALECALKEIETLRSRKAALSRANRALRDGLVKEKKEWEEKMLIEREDYANQINELSKQLTCESSKKLALQKELDEHRQHNLQSVSEFDCLDFNSQNKEMEANTRSVLEALEAAQKEIDSLREQRTALHKRCHMLRQQLKEKNDSHQSTDLAEDHNCNLVGKLQEACDEYHKLYVDKKRIEEKLDRLQQKIRTKVSSRNRQPSLSAQAQASQTSSITDLDDFETASGRSAAWRAMVEELM